MPKLISLREAAEMINDHSTIMVGGFMGCGTPHDLIDVIVEKGVKNLTLICNDASMPGGPTNEDFYGVAKLIHNHQISTLIASHVGLNPEVQKQSMDEETLEVILVPQGSLAEMIRAGGAGLGGVLTPTGVGTLVEDSPLCMGKRRIAGRDYLVMDRLHADIALIAGSEVDQGGNVWYRGDTSNFNPLMATAADLVIVEAEETVPYGHIRPEDIRTPGVYIDYVVKGGSARGKI